MIIRIKLQLGKKFNLDLELRFGSKTKRITVYIGR